MLLEDGKQWAMNGDSKTWNYTFKRRKNRDTQKNGSVKGKCFINEKIIINFKTCPPSLLRPATLHVEK